MFDHEKLQVYGKALDSAAKAAAWTSTWDKKHALVDHLSRATESILLNLAEAARQRGTPARLRIVDYAIGSSSECAGCLDVARIKELLTHPDCHEEDEAGTSVVLNIAEGNGRYAELDHHRFLQIAQSAAVKGAVFLDLV